MDAHQAIRHTCDEDERARWTSRVKQRGGPSNRIWAFTRGPASRADPTVHVIRGRILFSLLLAGAGPGRKDDGRVVRDFELDPTAREV